ncbi:hypothetical protein RND71_013004 [Anisodus tanguticus]|uniref:F-box domain-containing protein n=1 Tax=Anisodus tanguticus TaxID=243964 RepID=A0AAE1SGV1_9SOLA|nr:hypothetical protein RND71_013004 [Anisodus tanguticus]
MRRKEYTEARSLNLILVGDYCFGMPRNGEKHACQSVPLDILSCLPENVICDTLMCLPLRDAVRTSILSKKWRYRWNGIQHLVLELQCNGQYKLPSSLLTCLHLRHLSLQRCLLCPPPELSGVTISSDFPGSLISHSPLLEHLVLIHISNMNLIEIDAPKLRSLVFAGYIHKIRLRNVPLLAKDSVLFEPSCVKAGKHDLAKFFESIPALEHLLWKCNKFQCLIDEAVELQSALCLIRSSSYLEDIEIEVLNDVFFSLFCVIRDPPFSPKRYLDPDKQLDPATSDYVDEIPASFSDAILNYLREVKLKGIVGTRPEMQLIKLL